MNMADISEDRGQLTGYQIKAVFSWDEGGYATGSVKQLKMLKMTKEN